MTNITQKPNPAGMTGNVSETILKVRGWTKKLNKTEKKHLKEMGITNSWQLGIHMAFIKEHPGGCRACDKIAIKLGVE